MKALITFREQEILHLMALGHSSKSIAQQLGVSFHTVQTHRKNILRKLNESSTIRAVTVANNVGLLQPTGMGTVLYAAEQ